MVGQRVDQATVVMGRWVVVQSVGVEMAWFWWRGNFMSRHAVRKIPQVSRTDVSASDPVAVSSHYRVHVTDKVVKTRAVLCGRWRGRFGFAWRRRVLEALRGRAHQTRRVRQFERVLGLYRQATGVSVRSSLPLPSEVAVIEHFLAVGVQSPVISFPLKK